MAFVPPEARADRVPCHHIPLSEAGETVEILENRGDQKRLEDALKDWLRTKITELRKETEGVT
jgi:hypothetical protein